MNARSCTECGVQHGHAPGCPYAGNSESGDAFFDEYAGAMRVGSPGPCYGVEGRARTWHTLDPASVEELRDLGVGGGLAPCLDCGKMIFVPGKPDAGMMIHGLPERFAPKLGGVDARTGEPL